MAKPTATEAVGNAAADNTLMARHRQPVRPIDLRSIPFKDDPRPTWRHLQATGPVVVTRQRLLGRVAFATTHATCVAVLKDPERFTVDARRVGYRHAAGTRWWVPAGYRRLADNMLVYDGGDHRRLRRRVDRGFRHRTVESLTAAIERRVEQALDRLARAAAPDWVRDVARPLPREVIGDLMGFARTGVPHPARARRSTIDREFARLGEISGPLDLLAALGGARRLHRALEAEIDARRGAEPTDDLLGQLITGSGGSKTESHLDNDELVAMTLLLYAAGHETTTHLLSAGLLTLLREPGDNVGRPERLDRDAIMELLRHTGPVQFTKPRFVTEDCELGGVPLSRGDTVSALVAAANHDPEWVKNPAWLDLERQAPTPLGFGTGPHHCLGQSLAVVETGLALNHLFERFPGVRLAAPTLTPAWTRRLGLRSLERLPLVLG